MLDKFGFVRVAVRHVPSQAMEQSMIHINELQEALCGFFPAPN